MNVDTLEVKLGTFVTLSARDFMLNTGAAGTTRSMVSFGSVGARSPSAGSSSPARAATSRSSATAVPRRRPASASSSSIGSATGDSLQVAVVPPDQDRRHRHPVDRHREPPGGLRPHPVGERHRHQGPAAASSSRARSRASRSSRRCSPQGKFPIIGIDSIGVTVKGNLFGGELDAGLIGGILKLDAQLQHHRRLRHDDAGRPARLLPRHPGRLQDRRHGRLHDPPRPVRARAAAGVHQRRAARRHPARAATPA